MFDNNKHSNRIFHNLYSSQENSKPVQSLEAGYALADMLPKTLFCNFGTNTPFGS